MSLRNLIRASALAGALSLVIVGLAPAAELGFVYVESNVGGASGGHFALLVDGRVYSYYGAEDGTLALDRERWPSVRFQYATLENRPVHVAYVRIPEPDLALVRDELARDFLERGRHAAELERSRRNLELLRALAGEQSGITVEGAGLLDPTRPTSRAGLALRRRIEDHLGPQFLSRQVAEAKREVARLLAQDEGDATWTRVRERLEDLAALRTLERGDDLDPQAVLAVSGPDLSAGEREVLERARGRQATSVLDLLASTRPDRGQALFLAAARHHALSSSLDRSQLVLVDPFPRTTVASRPDAAPDERSELAAIARRTEDLLAEARARLSGGDLLSERDLFRLETLAARAHAYTRAVENTREAHVPVSPRRRARSVEVPTRGPVAIERALAHARDRMHAASAKSATTSRYGLIRRNCATEVVASLTRALGGPDAVQRALGSTLEEGEGLTFIPFVLFERVRDQLRVSRVERTAPFRERYLASLSEREASAWSRLRETATLTSRLYRPRTRDTAFLLFTDRAGWARPLYGVANLGYGAVVTTLGVASAPFDGGRRFGSGARGVLFSLPELLGVPLRKGTFDWVSLERGRLPGSVPRLEERSPPPGRSPAL